MKIYIYIGVVILVFFSYVGNNYFENKKKKEKQRSERVFVEEKTKKKLHDLVTGTNAIVNWAKSLESRKHSRFGSIFTIELEGVWLKEKPILYIGSIKDIKTKNIENYQITFEQALFSNYDFSDTELELDVECNKKTVDMFLQKNSSLLANDRFNNDVAIIAKIERIKTASVSGEDGERIDVKIGVGKCVSMQFIGDVRL